jgi:hypothetical protein
LSSTSGAYTNILGASRPTIIEVYALRTAKGHA